MYSLSEASLLDAAHRLADAERRRDLAALEQLLAPDYQGYDPAGRAQDRAVILRAYTESSLRLTELAQEQLVARVIGEVGLVAGVTKAAGEEGGGRFETHLRFLDVYAARDGRWQLIASQSTYLPW